MATDSFKGSLRATQVTAHLASGLSASLPLAEILELPLADGGEGLVDTMVQTLAGTTVVEETVVGPLGDLVTARWGWQPGRRLAIIEMAAASGLELVPPGRRNPWQATTYGTGQLITRALDRGAHRLIIGLGGSATNDGGAGMAQALGVKLLNRRGENIGPGAAGLLELVSVDATTIDFRLKDVDVVAACDVDNPLLGPRGAAAVYGPQKGAAPGYIPRLDAALKQYADLVEAYLSSQGGGRPVSLRDRAGAGAAGGMGFGLMAFLGAKLVPGARLVLEESGARDLFAGADLVITGEGKIDRSTLYGKLPVAVAALAQEAGAPVVAVCGMLDLPEDQWRAAGFQAIYPLVDGRVTRDEAKENAGPLLARLGRRLGEEVKGGRFNKT